MRKEVEKDQTITKIIQSMRTLELVQPFFTLFEFCDFWGFPLTRRKKNQQSKEIKMLVMVLGYALNLIPEIDYGSELLLLKNQ